MSYRFASCARRVPVADRLARHDRAVAVLERVDGGRADAARRRRAGDDHAVAAGRGEQARERRAEERRREQLVQHRLAGKRRDPGIDLDPAAAGLEREQRRDLVDERRGGALVAFGVGDGRVDDRELRAAELVEQPPDRRDDVLEVADERRRRVGEADG